MLDQARRLGRGDLPGTASATSTPSDIGRDPAEIERSVGVEGAPEDDGAALYDAGVRLFTVGQDGQGGYDLSRLKDWIAWRDERNG